MILIGFDMGKFLFNLFHNTSKYIYFKWHFYLHRNHLIKFNQSFTHGCQTSTVMSIIYIFSNAGQYKRHLKLLGSISEITSVI